MCIAIQLETSICGATRAVPGCSAGHAQGAGPFWPGLASRLHLHVLTARSALATSPAGRASNWRLRHFGTSRRCDDDSTAPRHFVTGRFSRPFLGNWEPRLLSFASPPFANKPYEYDDHGDEFYMLIDLLLYYPFTSLGRLFAISYQILSIAAPMHALPTLFFFLLGRKTDTARRRRTAGDEWLGPEALCATSSSARQGSVP
ncbi:hypothetical protein H0G86_012932 [Trichoderma simmonsii]|uniref:Uncharacterized protein n=1 Tax=Trichoderma simmonsii TaxID=1491479 RepID=A0A8G0PNU1_9HYPO|nr:hypothetical protein H0G86_012932 [Trichoderma simmonsii]